MKRLEAHCLSVKCSPKRNSTGSKKEVSKSELYCPDCGSTLHWRMMSVEHDKYRIHASSFKQYRNRDHL